MAVVDNFTGILSDNAWSGVDYPVNRPAFVTYSFEAFVQPYLTTTDFTQDFLDSMQPFSATEKDVARAALAQWGNASGLVFLEVEAGEGDIRFGSYNFTLDPNTSGFDGYGFYPYSYVDEWFAYRGDIAGDVFIDYGDADDLYLLLHEIGHALGFKHPFEGDPTLAPEFDNHDYTVMSYTGSAPGQLGIFDLQAVAAVYGDSNADGTQVASWNWNPTTRVLTQTGFTTDDRIFGVAVRDVISGAAGDDWIGGFQGDDSLFGGLGADRLFGNEGNDSLDGGADGDALFGGLGNDRYVVDSQDDGIYEYAGEGDADRVLSSVSYQLWNGSEIEQLQTTDAAATTAIDLIGNEFAQILIGNAGSNVLDGRGGADTMRGMQGNDTYHVDVANDRIVEAAGQGTQDRVLATVSYGLATGVEVERLEAWNPFGTAPLLLTGNEFHQTLVGNAGVNKLDGNGGADVMSGLGGDDTYLVDHASDLVVEAVGDGALDRIQTGVSYALRADVEVELLQTTDPAATTAITLFGNEFAQTIYGNAGANRIDGKGGADIMRGLEGDDIYYVDDAGDRIIDATGQGTLDRVLASVSYLLTAGAEIERMDTTDAAGIGAIDLTGNEFAQTIYGNVGNNRIDGRGGADTMRGLAGNDTYVVDNALDLIVDAAGSGVADVVETAVSYTLKAGVEIETLRTTNSAAASARTLTGNEFGQGITGNAGLNRIDGKGGSDQLEGLGGTDTFVFSTTPGAGNIDTILDFSVVDDTIELKATIFSAIVGTGVLSAGQFLADAFGMATSAAHRILYETDTGALSYDADGNGVGGSIQFASLSSLPAITAADFMVV